MPSILEQQIIFDPNSSLKSSTGGTKIGVNLEEIKVRVIRHERKSIHQSALKTY
jgi:hypothetical protein